MSNFFILGMPRSRTTWLTAFLNSPSVFCAHEVFSLADYDGRAFWDVNGYAYKGVVDNDPRYAKPYLVDLDAPLVVVERDCKEVFNSMVDKYNTERGKLKSALYDMYDELQVAKRGADLVIKFDDLDNYIEDICRLCTPSVAYDESKHRVFKLMNIQSGNIDHSLVKKRAN